MMEEEREDLANYATFPLTNSYDLLPGVWYECYVTPQEYYDAKFVVASRIAPIFMSVSMLRGMVLIDQMYWSLNWIDEMRESSNMFVRLAPMELATRCAEEALVSVLSPDNLDYFI